ncbi:SymE family type I addiction module toxin [Cohnella panacarvi]|uniref:SymE family type I addiction module toxin n=1 Tax=Cohnella panacarvi TaxID=400776 RepID=UPI00047C2009|nr:SymE family type I addiction module toxin [Cohnella panacarvi]
MEKKKRVLTVSSAFINNQLIPQIRIQGKWLNGLGFSVGYRVEVEEMQGELRITVLNQDKSSESTQ